LPSLAFKNTVHFAGQRIVSHDEVV